MAFFRRLFGGQPDDLRALETFEDSGATVNILARAIHKRYLKYKTPLFRECVKRVSQQLKTADAATADQVGAVASYIVTAEPCPDEKFVALSEEEREVANAVATNIAAEPKWKRTIGESSWWLAQYLITAKYDQSLQVVDKQTVDDAVCLLRRSIELYPSEARFYGTLANTYMAGKDFEAAFYAARKSVELDPRYKEGHRLMENIAYMIGYTGGSSE